jgi:hypothetical protein
MLAKYYRKKGFVIAAEDEATFGLIPHVVRGWTRRGSRPLARQNFQHKWRNVFAARSKRSFVFAFSKKKTQRPFVAFLHLLTNRWGKVCLFVDGAPCHKGARVNEFLAAHRKTFRLFRFPKYCPELNPVEQCWKPARQATGKRLIRSISTMLYHLHKTFGNHKLLPKMFEYLSN